VFARRVVAAGKDSTRRVPKPARPVLPALEPWWWRWAVAVGVLVILLLLLWWLTRRSRRPGVFAARDPYQEALTELDRIERLGLVDAGERGRYVALVTQVVRDYLAGRIPSAALSLTTLELINALNGDKRVPIERLRNVLDESDRVKFARARVSTERAVQVASEARQVVEETDTAVRKSSEEAAA
jgi:DNA-directed RNA polymerase subunit K/omega